MAKFTTTRREDALEARCRMTLAAMRMMNRTAGGLPICVPDVRTGSSFLGLTDAMVVFWQDLLDSAASTKMTANEMPKEWQAPADDEATLDAREIAAERAAWREEQESEVHDAEREGEG